MMPLRGADDQVADKAELSRIWAQAQPGTILTAALVTAAWHVDASPPGGLLAADYGPV
jgi:hypothetical protein